MRFIHGHQLRHWNATESHSSRSFTGKNVYVDEDVWRTRTSQWTFVGCREPDEKRRERALHPGVTLTHE